MNDKRVFDRWALLRMRNVCTRLGVVGDQMERDLFYFDQRMRMIDLRGALLSPPRAPREQVS